MFDDFSDVSDLLRGGIYILLYRSKVVFVGKTDKAMLGRITTHRTLARQKSSILQKLDGVIFDQILIRPVHPDRLDETYLALAAQHIPPKPQPERDFHRRV